jgi:tRNA-dihydrouridine synthase A
MAWEASCLKFMLKITKNPLIFPISIAPMLGWTTRHFRYFLRLISKKPLLYTEMITSSAILYHLDKNNLLGFATSEQPLVFQVGGGDPQQLAQAAPSIAKQGYSAINLNVGCPSHRVQSGVFGAVLFKKPELVAQCVRAMRSVVSLPISVKTRIAVDEYESYDYLAEFVRQVAAAGCFTFIIHARKAWLSGLSPKENREIPPLNYPWVYQLKQDFPALTIVLNGGVNTLQEANEHLNYVDGVMIGRAAWHNPYLLRALDRSEEEKVLDQINDRLMIAHAYAQYLCTAERIGQNRSYLLQPLFGLFHGVAGAQYWRQQLTLAIQSRQPLAQQLDLLLQSMSTRCGRC